VEIIVKKGAHCRYTTIQNWSNNVYNLVTKRAVAYEDARMEWVDANIGSKLTMKYPSVYLMEKGAHGEVLSVAFAGKGQHQDAGGKIVHGAPNTSSQILSKSISMHGGRASYRGLLKVYEGAHNSKSNVVCDALIMDEDSRTDTYPSIEIDEKDVTVGHEASVSKVGEDQLFYLDVARRQRRPCQCHDRQRLHRANCEGTARRVQHRAVSSGSVADGRLGRLIRTKISIHLTPTGGLESERTGNGPWGDVSGVYTPVCGVGWG
jgi:hypothetical protein